MKKNNEAISAQQANDAFNELALTGQSSLGITWEQAMQQLADAPDEALQDLSSEYFTFDTVGQVEHFTYEGNGTFEKDGKVVPVVKLRTMGGLSVINGDKVLYTACQRLQQVPSYIRVKYEENVKNNVGTYKRLTVKTFSPVK